MTHIRPLPAGTPDPRESDHVKEAWRAGKLTMRPQEREVFLKTELIEVETQRGTRLVVKRPAGRPKTGNRQ